MVKKWFLYNKKKEYNEILSLNLSSKISKFQAVLLANRHLTNREEIVDFLDPSLDKIHDPFLMRDMDKAVDLVINAIENENNIRIIGDYDQDGNSATMTLIDGLRYFTDKITYQIPHRIIDGYGLNSDMIRQAASENIHLIITCDNGINAFEAVELAKEYGIKILLTDHHTPTLSKESSEQILPKADAILNPKRTDCLYPFKDLCGAGVAFKLMQAVFLELGGDLEYLFELLEYVAMGTICDIVELRDENRILAFEGIRKIQDSANYGMQCLKSYTRCSDPVDEVDIGFVLGPCINASGRLSSAEKGIELFLSDDLDEIETIARELVDFNAQRKDMTKKGYESCVEIVNQLGLHDGKIIVIYNPDVDESIAGIIAGKIKDKFYKPTFVFTRSSIQNIIKGSGRSIESYNMIDEISKLSDLLSSFGGHPMAAGLSMHYTHIKKFELLINGNCLLKPDDFIKTLNIDLQLPIDMLSYNIIEQINYLKPFGKGNPAPLFADKKVKIINGSIIGKEQNVLKLVLAQGTTLIVGISFNATDIIQYILNKFNISCIDELNNGNSTRLIDIIYQPMINNFNNSQSIQLKIIDLR